MYTASSVMPRPNVIRNNEEPAAMSPPIRKTITRSRNGCAVCKSKRLKCDEAKPFCSRCERLGIPCPGYKKSLKWTTGPKPAAEQATTPGTNASNTSTTPQDMSEYAFEQSQSQPHAQPAPDLCNPVFAESFTDIINADAITFPDHTSIVSTLSFIDPSEEANQLVLDPGGSGPSPYSEYQETNEDEPWSNTNFRTAQPESNALERRAPQRRLSTPPIEIPLAKALQDHSSILVEYYFKEVCGLMSCYDSRMNPYRTAVSNVWSQSQSLYYIIQSMAAACLSEVSPNLSTVSRQLRDAAVSSLSMEASQNKTDTSSMLSLVMLGMSLSWHDPSSLGEAEFQLLAKTVSSSEMRDDNIPPAEKQKKLFFYNSLVYWRMLLSFVTDQDLGSLTIEHVQPHPSRSISAQQWELRMPHPQTGTGIEVMELVTQVGCLTRRERKRILSRRFSSRQDIEQAQNSIQVAEELHSKLCAIDLPIEGAIVDSGDEMTPTNHLLKIAEAYRCTGLLQLYRNFPDLVPLRASSKNSANQSIWLDTPNSPGTPADVGLLTDTWLTSLALHILDLVETIPVSSRSRSIQPFLLVSVCSEMSLGRSYCQIPGLRQPPIASFDSSLRIKTPPAFTDTLQARRAIVSRLAYFENILAAKPVRQMLILIKETWARMDEKRQDMYWMDVMIEKGYETLMG